VIYLEFDPHYDDVEYDTQWSKGAKAQLQDRGTEKYRESA
jgi:hypothetical protein